MRRGLYVRALVPRVCRRKLCRKRFLGTLRAYYCSEECRVYAWRERKRETR